MEPARPPGVARVNSWNAISRQQDGGIPLFHELPTSLRPYVLERPNHIGRMNLTGYLLGNGVQPHVTMAAMNANNAGNEPANVHVRRLIRDFFSKGPWSQGHRYLDQTLGHSLHPLRLSYPSYQARLAAGRMMGMDAVGMFGGRGQYQVDSSGNPTNRIRPRLVAKLGRGKYWGRGGFFSNPSINRPRAFVLDDKRTYDLSNPADKRTYDKLQALK